MEQQQSIRSGNYRYQPRDAVTQQHLQRQARPVIPREEPHTSAPPPSRRLAPPAMPQRPALSQERAHDNRAEPRERGRNNNNASPQNQGRNKDDDESNKGQGRK